RFTDDALAKVTIPVLVYAAEKDDLTQVRYHAERLARALPRGECVLVKGAGHFSFIARFPAAGKIVAGGGARSPGGFDRNAFHEAINREIVGFFNRTLRPAGNSFTTGARTPSCRSLEVSGEGARNSTCPGPEVYVPADCGLRCSPRPLGMPV